MAAKLKEKRTSITTVRDQFLSFATFPNHLFSHWPLPLTLPVPLPQVNDNVFEADPLVTGAMMNVPSPEPQTAMPVAKARFFSKYIDTLTIAGR
jgi:hypothetical protein